MNVIPRPKAVIFDMDGTIFDTNRVACRAWQKAAQEFGYHISDDLYARVVGNGSDYTKTVFARELGENFPFVEARDRRCLYFAQELSDKGVPIKQGLRQLLNKLASLKIPVALATSTKRKETLEILSWADMSQTFSVVLCGDEVEKGKPDPEIFLKVAQSLKILPSDCLVCEDSLAGIRAGHAAGMRVMMIPDLTPPQEETIKLCYAVVPSLVEVANAI